MGNECFCEIFLSDLPLKPSSDWGKKIQNKKFIVQLLNMELCHKADKDWKHLAILTSFWHPSKHFFPQISFVLMLYKYNAHRLSQIYWRFRIYLKLLGPFFLPGFSHEKSDTHFNYNSVPATNCITTTRFSWNGSTLLGTKIVYSHWIAFLQDIKGWWSKSSMPLQYRWGKIKFRFEIFYLVWGT